ncbi:MAG: diadenylate cyclase [Saprospiraceae bacterium]|nr:diadenylate cyclase [Saprospiraceae bacterium]
MFRVYKILKGKLAIYIFVGIISLFVTWRLVTLLKMDLLSMILGQFISVGVIAIIIIFQPEIRKFLLVLGNNAIKGNFNLIRRFLHTVIKTEEEENPVVTQIYSAMLRMSKDRTGALIVIVEDIVYPGLEDSGIEINATVTKQLILSIFNKESPLHDGALVIQKDRILKASCILPVSDNINVPPSAGLRHRAALGISEVSNAKTFIVSEETGRMSYTARGIIEMNVDEERILNLLIEALK